eukprot:6863717-Prymnesium_polylepis.1
MVARASYRRRGARVAHRNGRLAHEVVLDVARAQKGNVGGAQVLRAELDACGRVRSVRTLHEARPVLWRERRRRSLAVGVEEVATVRHAREGEVAVEPRRARRVERRLGAAKDRGGLVRLGLREAELPPAVAASSPRAQTPAQPPASAPRPALSCGC